MAKAVESRRFCIALSWKAVLCRACFCQVISVAYSCSLILIEAASASPQFRRRLLQVPHLQRASKVLDVMKPILHKRKIEYELEGFGCAPQQSSLHLYVNSP